MLLRFGVENHLSICHRQEITFVASSLKDQREGLISCDAGGHGAVLPALVIYGANASGKTNLVNAIETMQGIVLWSQTKGEPGGGVPRHEFRLDRSWSDKPSCFDIDFVIDGVRYHYGFETTDEEISSEWLYEIPRAHKRKMFERKNGEFMFGRSLPGKNSIIKDLTRPNSLFLSAAAQNGHAQLSRIYAYFQQMEFTLSTSIPGDVVSERLVNSGIDDRVIKFLTAIDTGIVGYRRNESEIPDKVRAALGEPNARIDQFGNAVGRKINIADDDEGKIIRIEMTHQGSSGEKHHFNLGIESAGTRRLLILLSKAFHALDQGSPVIVDELDASLHSYASAAVVRLFCTPDINRKGAQLIATTHDTNLMTSADLRRDQLWFAEKGRNGATELFSLSDIRTRKGDNFELGYLQGRYGAVATNDPVATFL